MEQNLSVEVLKGKILLEANAANYQKLLQGIEDITFDKNDLKADQPDLVALSAIEKRLGAIKNPYTADWKRWNDVYGSITKPITEGLQRKRGEFGKLATEIKAEKQEAENYNLRIAGIKAIINTRAIDFSQKIASATTLEELIAIEKLIGSEKARKNIYQEFLPNLIMELDNLTPLIKAQKGNIKELEGLAEAKKVAEETGDDRTFLIISETEDALKDKIEQAQSHVQHVALNSAINQTSEVEAVSTAIAPKPKRTYCDYIVTDIEKLKKFHPEFIKTEVDDEKIKDWIKFLRSAGQFKECENNGLKLFIRNTY